ncbi:MAG: type II toxin-antitoxin system PemK/MazF family toxin [Alkalispirochaeta sp.]
MVLVTLNPTRGREIQKTRPCVIVSPDELNARMGTFIVAPLTTGAHRYPFRVGCVFENRTGLIVLDQIGTVDRTRLERRLGSIDTQTLTRVLDVLQEMFAP